MLCPKCGERGYVNHTIQKGYGILRYYHCPKCYCRWKTVERIEQDHELKKAKGKDNV